MDISDLLESEDVRMALREFASLYKPAMTAEEFLQYMGPQVGIGASVGHSLGNALGFSSTTRETFAFPQSPTTTCLASLCCLLANGVAIEAVEPSSTGGTLLVSGAIPSSVLHFGGRITIEVSARPPGSEVSMIVAFPGQLIAWGAGKRLVVKLRSGLDRAAARVRQCPSVSAH